MKLYELAVDNYCSTDLNCAESIVQACDDYYHLNLSEEVRKMTCIFGDGMQCNRSCCGALSGAVAIIGLLTTKSHQIMRQNELGAAIANELCESFGNTFGTLTCCELWDAVEVEDQGDPCPILVEAVARKLEELLEKNGITRSGNPMDRPIKQ